MSRVLIIGAGAAGMFAAAAAAEHGQEVHLYEKNERLGKKLYITGKGRCNLTNACETEELFGNICSNPRFLYSAFYGCTNFDVIDFFERRGMKTKTERGGRVFPLSDRSADVIDVLRRAMAKAGVKVHLNSEVQGLLVEELPEALPASEEGSGSFASRNGKKAPRQRARVRGLCLSDGRSVKGDAVIVSTGGLSYPSTGSTGDGYRFAADCGHTVTDCYPSLVPFHVQEAFVKELQGLSLKNVTLSVYDGTKCLYEEMGEMMFTHFGVTGPLVLTASASVQRQLRERHLRLKIDLKPALTEEQLDDRILREFEKNSNRQFKNVIGALFPARLTPVMIALSGIPPEQKVHTVTRAQRSALVHLIKDLELTATGLRDYNEAIVTRGGVAVKEIDPGTMESKLVSGLYFAGEVLDLDALTGGFNLQIAWSTGYAAGMAAGREKA